MPQQYHSLPDTMYTDYRQPPPSYQDNYQLMYPHSNFQPYRTTIPSTSATETAYDYSQQYYPSIQPSNSYAMLPSYNSNSSSSSGSVTNNTPANGFGSNFHATPYTTNFHTPPYSTFDGMPSTSPTNPLIVKTDLEPERSDHDNGSTINANLVKNSPIESSDRSESSLTSKLDVCSKSNDNLTDLSESIGNSEQNPVENIYQSCSEENMSSK